MTKVSKSVLHFSILLIQNNCCLFNSVDSFNIWVIPIIPFKGVLNSCEILLIKSVFDLFEELDDLEDDWGDDEYDYIDNEDSIISFLNEYYVVYPKKLPKPVFK